MNIGHKIRLFRAAAGVSQADLEKLSGIKREYLSKMESGELKNPTLKTLTKIANALGVQLRDLFDSCPDVTNETLREAAKMKRLNELLAQATAIQAIMVKTAEAVQEVERGIELLLKK